jgi:2-methylisocitrate lyase-like PEP mutase family enzyme
MSFRSVLARESFLTLPGAHDAISARLIKQAGFRAYFIGGFPLVGARFGVPDVGIAMLGEISAAVRDILGASDLPVMVDGDNGYGDVKSLVYTMHTYERLGVTALMFEDQVAPKRCGHIAGKDVIPMERMAAHIRAAVENRLSKDTFILARTDARDVNGLDDALRRAERYLKAGADGLFVESPHDIEELTRIGRAFDVPQMANMLEGGRTPVLTPSELREAGFAMGVYGISLLLHSVHAMQDVLTRLKAEDLSFMGKATGFDEFKSLVGFEDWSSLEKYYGGRK